MRRKLYNQLLNWKRSPHRKPLILKGARQVGKTWLLKDFGLREYGSLLYVNCERESFAQELFSDFNVHTILEKLEAHSGIRVVPGETLVVFDEVQEVPRGLEALKYFQEDAPGVHVAVAGSLLGIAIHHGVSFPVGKVDELTLHPLDFREFLEAAGKKGLADALRDLKWSVVDALREELLDWLRRYFFAGGMPEAVNAYLEERGLAAVRSVQSSILSQYEQDFSKHVTKTESMRIRMVWNSLLPQLAKENRKFVYGALKTGGRAKEFESAIQWLVDAGLVHRVCRIGKAVEPLKYYEEFGVFKLYPLDVGLMGALAETRIETMFRASQAFEEYRGAFSEAFVLSEMLANGTGGAYYFSSNDSMVEIDFLRQTAEGVTPFEVKAAENLQSKSLRTFVGKHPGMKGVRFSLSPYREQDWLRNVPLYAAGAYLAAIDVQPGPESEGGLP